MLPSPTQKIISTGLVSHDQLKQFMQDHGVSIMELSEILGVTQQAVKLWINNERKINLMTSRLIRLFDKNPLLLREFPKL